MQIGSTRHRNPSADRRSAWAAMKAHYQGSRGSLSRAASEVVGGPTRSCWRRSSFTSRSSSVPGVTPASTRACFAQPRSVSGTTPTRGPIRRTAPFNDKFGSSDIASDTRRRARSRSSFGYFLGAGTGPLSRGFRASINPGAVHPQTCGKVERFHQTQKKWLAAQPPAATIAELQKQLDAFRRYYNTIRPHRALGRRTPAEANAARPKAIPAGPVIDPHYRVRTDRVDISGVVTLRHNSRLHHIGLGRARARTRVTMLIDDLHIRVLTDTGELLRELLLDPNRDYQPQTKT